LARWRITRRSSSQTIQTFPSPKQASYG